MALKSTLFSSHQLLYNLSISDLVTYAVNNREAVLTKSGALAVTTSPYTGRLPNDKFIVDHPRLQNQIDWGKNNLSLPESGFNQLYKKMVNFLSNQNKIFVVDAVVGEHKDNPVFLRAYCQLATHALFITHLFRRPNPNQSTHFYPDLMLFCAPGLSSNPKTDHTHSSAFIVLHLIKKIILIGTTAYAGEIKKAVFTYVNYYFPKKNVFTMHCAANVSPTNKASALFFGLSGTGKTTLSADPKRQLVGDDEHGWSRHGIFNIEAGCYAKCIRIKITSEPLIWKAIHRYSSIVENVPLTKSGRFNFNDDSVTENTRAAYPLSYIANSLPATYVNHPRHVIFLTADAAGVLPPVAHLTLNQAAFHFLSGYTSKLAGTEKGIKQPVPVFSAYFGAPFMPLKPMVYLNLLRYYLKRHQTKVYLVNTGWIGGGYGVGNRIPLNATRKIVSAILSDQLDRIPCRYDNIFNLFVPYKIPGLDSRLLDPTILWPDKNQYLRAAKQLTALFSKNIRRFSAIDPEIINSGPTLI